MKLASAISTKELVYKALEEACARAREGLGEAPTDLAMVFVTASHKGDALDRLPEWMEELTGAPHLLGCTAEGIVGGGEEVERAPAVSVLLAHLPGVGIHPFSFDQVDLDEIDIETGFAEWIGVPMSDQPAFLLLGDPFSVDARRMIDGLNDVYPGRPVIGGMASAGFGPDENRIFFEDETLEEGAAGLALTGDLRMQTIVSQGCRPVGKHLVITKAKGNIILELGGKPASLALGQILASLTPDEREGAKGGIHVGRVIEEARSSFGRGDFLIRNLMGIDPETGAIAVGDHFRPGQTIQFHMRDAETAREDLEKLLSDHRQREKGAAAGGLLFTCNGRGERLFGVKNHDSGMIRNAVGEVPLAGFFCAGEFGPVGGSNFLHGFTSSIAFFSPK